MALEFSGAADIEITVYVGLGAEGEEQVREAVKAASMLEEMGFVVTVQPVTVEWDVVSLEASFGPRAPAVEVNGKALSEGRLVRAEEIVAHALAVFAATGSPAASTISSRGRDKGEVSVSLAA